MTSQEETQQQLDAALDAALDDLDDDDDDDEVIPQPAPQQSAPRPVHGPIPPPSFDDGMGGIDDMMKQLMQQGDLGEGGGDEFLGRLLQEMQTQIGAELEHIEKGTKAEPPTEKAAKSPTKQAKAKQKQQSAPTSSTSSQNKTDVDQAISSLIEGMANQAKMGETDMNNGPEADLLQNMMDQLGEGLGGGNDDGFNADALIDGMMEQLLAKDLMYEPMQKVAEKFPDWLKENKDKVPPEEYDKRRQQFQCFQKLVHAYDNEPQNTQLIMQLMQEVQEFGQPPSEIIQNIAPGLEFDADGLPIMNGAGGLPFPGADEECRIM